jgi:hypothetical protein
MDKTVPPDRNRLSECGLCPSQAGMRNAEWEARNQRKNGENMSQTRCSQKDRYEFVHLFMKHANLNGNTEYDLQQAAQRLLRYGATLGRIAVDDCNGPGYPNGLTPEQYNRIDARWEAYMDKQHAKEERINVKVTELCAKFGCKPVFSGDPRGCVLKIGMPDGFNNSWGGEGLCVPTA